MLAETFYTKIKELPDDVKTILEQDFTNMIEQDISLENALKQIKLRTEHELLQLNSVYEEAKVSNQVKDYISSESELADTKWFMFSPLVQMTLPHRDTKSITYRRTNGISELTWVSKDLVPFGTHARLLLIYAGSMAVKSSSPIVSLGPSRKGICKDMGLTPSGPLLKSINVQLNRLRSSMITLEQKQKIAEQKKLIEFNNHRVFSSGIFWWDDGFKNEGASLEFSSEFYLALKDAAVPFNKEVLFEFKSSCLALDMYMFLTYRSRIGHLRAPIPWEGLFHQIGSNHANLWEFKRDLNIALKRVSPYINGYSFSPVKQGLLIRKK